MNTPLINIRRELFALALFKGMSGKDAAIEAGYCRKWARSIAHRLSTNVYIIGRIAELHELARTVATMPVQERQERLSEIGRGRLTDFVLDGQPELTDKTPNNGAACEYYIRHSFDRQGGPVVTKSIKLHNPISAIAELNKMDHIYDERLPAGTTIVNSFTFILPDGTRVSPKQLKEVNSIEVEGEVT